MDDRPQDRTSTENWNSALLVGAAVLIVTWVSISVANHTKVFSPIWPGNAIVVASMVSDPKRRWGPLILCGFVGGLVGNFAAGNPWLLSLILSVSNTFEIAICSFGLWGLLKTRPDLSRRRDFWSFVGLCGVAAVASALITSSVFGSYRRPDPIQAIALWGLADGLGLLILTPIFLVFSGPTLRAALIGPGRLRRAALVTGLIALDVFAFTQTRYSVLFIVSAAMLVLVFEMETLGAVIGLLCTTAIGVGATFLGHGPAIAGGGDLTEGELSLQVFLAVSAVLSLAVAATLTRSRRLQDALTESEALYRTLTDQATDITMRFNADWIIEFASPAIRQLGYEPADIIGRRVVELLHPDEASENRRIRNMVFEEHSKSEPVVVEFRVLHADGHWVWIQGKPTSIANSAGDLVGALSVWRDISSHKAAETAVAASEAKYRLLAESATDVIARCDLKGVLTYLSPAALRVFGYPPEALIGTDAMDLVHPDDVALVNEKISLLYADRGAIGSVRIEYRLKKKDGQYVWIEANPSLIIDPETGRVVALQDCTREISVRKALEAELRRKQLEAEAAAQAKSDFLANMSHEIRTPLTGIIGFGALLETVEGLPAPATGFVKRISTASQALLAVVNDILDFSKIDAGQIELDPHPFDPTAFVAETMGLVADQAQAKGLTLHSDISDGLPAAVHADSSRVRQVLLNLLTNAIKFTNQGGVTIKADYVATHSGSLRFEVADTGVGVPAELTHRLFQRFSQIDGSTTRQYGGTGLGLAICKGLTEAMGGEIGMESRGKSRGSTFWFTVAAPMAGRLTPETAEDGGDWRVGVLEILLVDDVEMNRELVSALLSPFDIKITEASGGALAVEAALKQSFDVILMDLQMPGMDGLAATRAIRANSDLNKTTPILALSANVLPEHLSACRLAGMNDHIAKPIQPEELLGKVALWSDADRAAQGVQYPNHVAGG